MANRRHMHTQLMHTPGNRHQLNPGERLAQALKHLVKRYGALAVLLVDGDFLKITFFLLGKRQVYLALRDFRRTLHQGPINFLRFLGRENMHQPGRRLGITRNHQHAAGIAVETMH